MILAPDRQLARQTEQPPLHGRVMSRLVLILLLHRGEHLLADPALRVRLFVPVHVLLTREHLAAYSAVEDGLLGGRPVAHQQKRFVVADEDLRRGGGAGVRGFVRIGTLLFDRDEIGGIGHLFDDHGGVDLRFNGENRWTLEV